MSNLSTSQLLDLLRQGTMEMDGLISWGSNYTFLTRVCSASLETEAIYKPRKGERPLWDFPPGTLCLRERAAFLVSEGLSWNLVPPTVLRDGPHGWGSVQHFIDHDPNQHYFTLQGSQKGFATQLQQIVLFDVLVNNADRKGGHVLLDYDDKLWSIDHGICFHADYKLRSVIWDFAGMSIPAPLLAAIENFGRQLEDEHDPVSMGLHELLNEREFQALRRRARKLVRAAAFPQPGPGRHYPWPPV